MNVINHIFSLFSILGLVLSGVIIYSNFWLAIVLGGLSTIHIATLTHGVDKYEELKK
jgi:hypothetical protein